MSTGRTRVRGVTTHSAEQRRRGKTVTAAGGREREQFCGGEKERKEARQGDAPRLSRRVGKDISRSEAWQMGRRLKR